MNRTISERTARAYECLRNQVAYLYLQWALFQNLFMQDEASLRVLEKYGGSTFDLLHRLMIDNFVLTFMNLLSKEKIKGHQQLCLIRLIRDIETNFPGQISKELNQIYDNLEKIGSKFKKQRHNRIAHSNLKIKIADSKTGKINTGVTIKDMREFLDCLQRFMNTFADSFNLSRPGYENFIDEDGRKLDDVQDIMRALIAYDASKTNIPEVFTESVTLKKSWSRITR